MRAAVGCRLRCCTLSYSESSQSCSYMKRPHCVELYIRSSQNLHSSFSTPQQFVTRQSPLLRGPGKVVESLAFALLFNNEVVLSSVLLRIHVVDRPVPIVTHDWPPRSISEESIAIWEHIGSPYPICDTGAFALIVPPAAIRAIPINHV